MAVLLGFGCGKGWLCMGTGHVGKGLVGEGERHVGGSCKWFMHGMATKSAQSWLGREQANGFVILVLGLWFSFNGLWGLFGFLGLN